MPTKLRKRSQVLLTTTAGFLCVDIGAIASAERHSG